LKFDLNGDELLLAIIALVRAINPSMLKAEQDGYSVDFSSLEGKTSLSTDEQLLVALRIAADSDTASLNLDQPQALRLAAVLQRLETLQSWPADVLTMSAGLRSRLASVA
jgi:hypothetical protein